MQNVFIPLVTAFMVAWLNYSVSQVDRDLKERIADVDISIREAKDDRDKINTERESLLQNSKFHEPVFVSESHLHF